MTQPRAPCSRLQNQHAQSRNVERELCRLREVMLELLPQDHPHQQRRAPPLAAARIPAQEHSTRDKSEYGGEGRYWRGEKMCEQREEVEEGQGGREKGYETRRRRGPDSQQQAHSRKHDGDASAGQVPPNALRGIDDDVFTVFPPPFPRPPCMSQTNTCARTIRRECERCWLLVGRGALPTTLLPRPRAGL